MLGNFREPFVVFGHIGCLACDLRGMLFDTFRSSLLGIRERFRHLSIDSQVFQ